MISLALRNIVAKLDVEYDHSSLQINLPESLAATINAWSLETIPEDILHNDGKDTKGREDDIHTTLFYGIKSPSLDSVLPILDSVKPFNIRLGLITPFMDKDDYDVLKIDASAPELYELHYKIREKVDNDNHFPTYSPHVTIAYLKKGHILKWVGNPIFKDQQFTVAEIEFSSLDGDKIPIKLK